MSQEIDLTRIERQVFRDSYQDGLMEILTGVLLVAAGITFRTAPAPSVVLLALFVLAPGYKLLKKRFTYPRTGYVELIEEEPKDLLRGMLTFTLIATAVTVLILVILGELRDAAGLYRWTPALVGVVCTGGFLYAASKSGMARYYGFIVVSVVSGSAFSILDFESWKTGLSLHLLVVGGLLLLCGVVIFCRFLRRHPVLVEESPDVGA